MKFWELLPIILACYYTIIFGQLYPGMSADNLMEFLKNERIFQRYVNCIFERGPCTTEGEKLKIIIPDFFENECANCSEREREVAEKVITFIKDEKPDVWDELVDKYLPEEATQKPMSLLETFLRHYFD